MEAYSTVARSALAADSDDVFASALPIHGVPRFWERVQTADSCALFLDYDGTLAPFHTDRMLARPLEGVVDALLQIIDASDTQLAIVSGRPTAEILHLAGDLGLTVIGSHGWESHRPGVGRSYVPVSTIQQGLLDAAHAFAVSLLGEERVERKVASVAAHLRGLDAAMVHDIETQLATSWLASAGPAVLEYRPFNGGVELRALGRHKGSAILELQADMPRDTLPVFVGDDDTDEDAFRAIATSGIGIKVGAVGHATAARGRLADLRDTPRFLADWARVRSARRAGRAS